MATVNKSSLRAELRALKARFESGVPASGDERRTALCDALLFVKS